MGGPAGGPGRGPSKDDTPQSRVAIIKERDLKEFDRLLDNDSPAGGGWATAHSTLDYR